MDPHNHKRRAQRHGRIQRTILYVDQQTSQLEQRLRMVMLRTPITQT